MQPASRIIASSNSIEMDEQSFIRVDLLQNEVLAQRLAAIAMEKRTVIFTSKNSVVAVAKMLDGKQPEWNIYCLEGATLKAIQQYFTKVRIVQMAQDAIGLAKVIDAHTGNEPAIFFCGDKRMHTIPEAMTGKGVALEEIVVYKTSYTPSVMLKKYDGILFFSKSAVESFASANKWPAGTTLFAIGATTAGALKDYAGDAFCIIQSPNPGEQTLMKTIIDFYNDEE